MTMYSKSAIFNEGHYIHKYYLPTDMRRIIFPVDIEAIASSTENSVTIYYKDLELEKHVDADTCQRVRSSWQEYWQDCHAELTPDEEAYCVELNKRLTIWQNKVAAEISRLEEEMESRLATVGGFAEDYEIEVLVYVFLQDDDPLCSGASQHGDWDMDVSLIARLELYKQMLEDYSPEDQGRECNLFHKLVDHVGIPYKHLCRIGRISTDVRVWHQNEWKITKPAFPRRRNIPSSSVSAAWVNR
jgi:hypothetical protein